MRAWEFFDQVHEGYLTEFDMLNMIEEMTGKFNAVKLNLLCKEFDFYLFMKRDEYICSFSHEEIQIKKHELERSGKKIPMLSDKAFKPFDISDFFQNEKVNFKKNDLSEEQKRKREELSAYFEEGIKEIPDVIKMMDPLGLEFYSLYKLRNMLIDLKRKHTDEVYKFDDPSDQVNNIQPISWLKSDEALYQFIEALKAHQLIEAREAGDIINQHFKALTGQKNKPEPIKWLKTNRLLSYLITELAKAELIATEGKQWRLVSEHFIRKNGEKFNTDSLKQDALNMKYTTHPKGSKIVDKVINSIF